MKFNILIVTFLLGLLFISCDKNEPEINLLGNGQVELKAYPDNKHIGFYIQAEKVIIDWGDGAIEEFIPKGTEFDTFGHFYSDTILKTVLITTEKMTYFSIQEASQLKFGNCPVLTVLLCPALPNRKGSLKTLDITKLESLEELVCYNNQLMELDLSKNTMLTWLECRQNNLKKIDVSKNKALVRLDCGNNQLTNLDVSQNTALELLYCHNNKINNLDVTKNLNLVGLYCPNNQLSSLDIGKNTALAGLDLSKNKLTNLNVVNNTILNHFWCSDNQLTSLDVSKNSELDELYCSNNQLTAQALNSIFEGLPIIKDPAMGGMLFIGGNIGTNECNRSIATKKWWALFDK